MMDLEKLPYRLLVTGTCVFIAFLVAAYCTLRYAQPIVPTPVRGTLVHYPEATYLKMLQPLDPEQLGGDNLVVKVFKAGQPHYVWMKRPEHPGADQTGKMIAVIPEAGADVLAPGDSLTAFVYERRPMETTLGEYLDGPGS